MPTYTVQSPTGQNLSIEGDTPPTEKELDDIFAKVAPADVPAPVQPAGSPGEQALAQQGFGNSGRDYRGPRNPRTGLPDLRNPDKLAAGANTLKDMGLEGGGIAIGQAIGTPFAEFGGVPIAGAVGGFLGSLAAQATNFADPNAKFSMGRAVTNAGLGLIPGSFVASPAVSPAIKGAVLGGANVAGANLQNLIDYNPADPNSKPYASPGQDLTAFGAGLVAPRLSFGAKGPQPTANETLFGAGQQQSFRNLRKEGFKVLPQSIIGQGSDTAGALSQRTNLQREINLSNQFAAQKLGRAYAGLSKTATPITHAELENLRNTKLAGPYEEFEKIADTAKNDLASVNQTLEASRKAQVTAIGGHELAVQDAARAQVENAPFMKNILDPIMAQAGADVNALKISRKLADQAYRRFDAGDPAAFAEWEKHVADVDALNGQLVDAANAAGRPKLADQLAASRRAYAKTFQLQAAIPSPKAGLVDMHAFGRTLQNRPGYLTDEAEKMGQFALDFPRDTISAVKVLPPGVNNMAAQQQLQMVSSGNPIGAAAAAVSKFAGKPLRAFQRSESYQNRLAQPQMQTGALDLAQVMARFSALSAGRQQQQAPAPMFNLNFAPR